MDKQGLTGASASQTGLLPSVEPVPVSPADAAAIPSVGWARFLLHDEDNGLAVYVRPEAVLSVTEFWQDTFGNGGGYSYCILNLGHKIARAMGTASDILTALATADAQTPSSTPSLADKEG